MGVIGMLTAKFIRPAHMAEWCEALPLTAHSSSSLSGFRIRLQTCEEVASDFQLGGVFRRVPQI